VFLTIPFGSSGSNELGGHFVFPGTYAVRPVTLRAVFMDLASELGELRTSNFRLERGVWRLT
jgi:hypothetical protein